MDLLYLADIRLPLERANGLQTVSTCHALAARGHRVTLLVRPDTAADARDPLAFYGLDPIDGFEIARVPVAGPAPLRRAHYLAAAVRHSLTPPQPTAVFTRDLGVASLLARLPRAGRPPLVYESHGYAPTVSALMPTLHARAASASAAKLARLERRERRVWGSADGYVTLTTAHAEELADRFGPRRAVAVVPDGTRLMAERAFAWAGPHAERPVVAYAGHLGRGVRQHQDVGVRDRAGDVLRRQEAGELNARAQAARRRQRGDALDIGLPRMPADDAPVHVGQQRQRLDQHVDALPRIEMSGVGDDRTLGVRAGPRERALGHQPRAVGDDGDGAARPEPVGELLGVGGGQRHVAVG